MTLTHQRSARLLGCFLFLALVILLAGCSGGQDDTQVVAGAAATPAPTATKDAAGYAAIQPQACLVADWTNMQSNRDQGSLVAWQPQTGNIAYMAPSERSSWFIGTLMLAKGPDYKRRVPLAGSTLAAGDLTWSPSGDLLAFLAFRPNENLYTVMVVHADGSGLVDLFPTDLAHTDSRTSQKSILGWKSENTLQVMASCGEECRQGYDIRVDAPAGPVLTPTPIDDYRELAESLQVPRRTQEYKPEEFPRNMPTPNPASQSRLAGTNWSPDGRYVDYLDKRGILWLMKQEEKTMYTLDIGLRDVYETQWSEQSDRLAIRAEDRIFVFEIPCRSKSR